MDLKQTQTPLTERKVVRRGLIAGLAGLGAAALLKVTGTGKARADDGAALFIGSNNNQSQTETRLRANPSFAAPALQVINAAAFSPSTVKAAVVGYSDAIGVFAVSTGTTSAAVQGNNFSAGPSGIGVSGVTDTGTGVRGTASNAAAFGVRGINSINGTGIRGVSNAALDLEALGSGFGVGTQGLSGSGIGVQGMSTGGPGVEGVSVNHLGVRGTSTNFVGVVGISTNSHGLYGYSTHPQGVGLVGDHGGGGLAGVFNGRVEVYGSFQVFGVKNAVLKMPDGSNALVYCQESPEPYFEDFGRAQLIGGVANVPIERDFAALVAGGDYHVFTEPEGETRGLFVSRRGAGGFEVRELGGGTGSVRFSYRIVTRRKDVEGKRFARVSDEGAKSIAATRAGLGVAGGPAGTPPFVQPPNPPVLPNQPLPPSQNVSSQNGPLQPGGPMAPGSPSDGRR